MAAAAAPAPSPKSRIASLTESMTKTASPSPKKMTKYWHELSGLAKPKKFDLKDQLLSVSDVSPFKRGGVVHFKGFASGVDFTNKHTLAGVCAAIRELNKYNIIAFDGDKISKDSFTWLLTNALYKGRRELKIEGVEKPGVLIPELTVKKFVAFTTGGEHMDECYGSAIANGIPMNESANEWNPRKIKPGLTCVKIEQTWKDDGKWHHLGVAAIEKTQSKNVVTLGGGETVVDEMKETRGQNIKYVIVPIDRMRGGATERTFMCKSVMDPTFNASFVLFGGGSRVSGGVAKDCHDFFSAGAK